MLHYRASGSRETRRLRGSCCLTSANVEQRVNPAYVHQCISIKLHLIHALVCIVLVVSEMKVVIVAIAQKEDGPDKVDEGSWRGILAEVASLISAEQPLRIDLWSWTSRQLFVEARDSLHTCSIFGSTNCGWRCNLWWDQG